MEEEVDRALERALLGKTPTGFKEGENCRRRGIFCHIINIVPETEWRNKEMPEYLIMPVNASEAKRVAERELEKL